MHLTINYPALSTQSRLKIWRNFLGRAEVDENLTDKDMEILANVDLNGRRIRNVVKSAQIMAQRESRGVGFADITKVLRITEGLQVETRESRKPVL